MQEVTHIADGNPRARADVPVRKFLGEFQTDQFAAAFVENFQAQPHEADAFQANDLFIGQGRGIGGVADDRRIFIFGGSVERHNFGGAASLVQREVVDGTVKPSSRFADLIELRV